MIVELRKTEPGDIGWLISTHGEIYAEEFGFNIEFEWDIAKKAVSFKEKEGVLSRIIIAWVDGVRAGSVAVSEVKEKKAFVNFLLVRKEYRKKGIAEKLLKEVIDHATYNKMDSISLETYCILKGARRLYRKRGFVIKRVNKDIEIYEKRFDQEFWQLKLG